MVAGGHATRELADEVVAGVFLALAEHHRDLAGASLRAGRTVLAGAALAQASREMQMAYETAGLSIDATTQSALEAAVAAGEHLEQEGTEAAVQSAEGALTDLLHDATRLENALGARRR